ncbi:4-hydroxyphenylpyruvate dioxygenase [bacterium CG_4_9_14_3_um_filter_65_15]|nr:MAG: 4-hydroxyphenylpyruvate dioxygenase [bacterium CG_4_9_14_3_um_filter_65_15]
MEQLVGKVHHVELVVGNAKQAAYYYRKAFGFDQVAYRGPETGDPTRASYVLRQGDIWMILTTPLHHLDSLNNWLTLHGDGVRDIALEVADVDAAYAHAVAGGAVGEAPPRDHQDAAGTVRTATIRTFGEVLHTMVQRRDYPGFLPGFAPCEVRGIPTGLTFIDHIVGNVEDRQMERWVDWYDRTLGLGRFVSYDDKDISTEYTALRSTVVASADRVLKFPLNEPADGLRKSQIQEYIDANVTAGVQHIALACDDILAAITALRANGVEFLTVPRGYYGNLWDRVGEIGEDRDRVRDLGILVDRDDQGYLLQLFTRPVQDRPTLFIEIIQRRGSNSFGKGNFKALFETIEQEQALRGNL